MTNYLMIATIVIALTLTVVILVQAQGSGLGSAFGGDSSIYRTRRGVEKTLFNITVALTIIFLFMSWLTVALS
jgi:preprotein translocase subunit SecG